MIYYVVGNRGSGKSSVDELIGEENYLAGHTVVDLHSASNYESLYWCINKNCGGYWEKQKQQTKQKISPHCTCSTRYPIILVVPEYTEFDQNPIDKFNEKFISRDKWIAKGGEPSEYRIKIRKPDGHIATELRLDPDYIEWLKVTKLILPNKGFKNRDKFCKQLTEIIITAQKERRIVVLNPIFFKKANHKMIYLEQIIRELPEIVRANFQPPTGETIAKLRGVEGSVPYSEWTQQERNRHRVTLIFREFGSLVASSLTEEKEQILVKKAIFWLVKVIRHYRMTLVADFQRFGDVYAGVKEQRDVIIFKRCNRDIFPDQYNWLEKENQLKFDGIKEKLGWVYAKSRCPSIEDLRNDQMIVVYTSKTSTGKRYKLFKARTPFFHHHQEDDEWEMETGIIKETPERVGTWRFISTNAEEEPLENQKDEIVGNIKIKSSNFELYEYVQNYMAPGKTYHETFVHLKEINRCPKQWKNENALRTFVFRMKKKPNSGK